MFRSLISKQLVQIPFAGYFKPLLIHQWAFLLTLCSGLLSLNCLKLYLPGLPYNLLYVSFGDIGSQEIGINEVLAWKAGHKVPLLPCGPSCPVQPILLGDLVSIF